MQNQKTIQELLNNKNYLHSHQDTIKISSTVITPITLENLITPQRLD